MMRRLVLVSVLLASAARGAELAPGVTLIPGSFAPPAQPDGNTVVFRGTTGLVVVDTGRHPEHTQKILDFAREAHQPVAAIVNTHWHLDHVGGNLLVKKAFPDAAVYASSALEGALKGFLLRYRAQLTEMIDKTPDPEKQKPLRAEVALIDAGKALGPTEVVTKTGERTIAGRKLVLGLEAKAATAGDVWVFDPETRVLASGDLVTVPVPFLDTACPEGWKAALEDVSKKDFATLVPGHGAPMNRKGFETYRTAFGNLLACAASKAEKDACIDGWTKDAADLLSGESPKLVRGVLDYYVAAVLRGDPAQTSKLCGK
jgi:glyoxylase-like metal-dependent hydrolase (beta-lactamase superfamily II)